MKRTWTTEKIVYTAVLAALVCAVTFFRFPLFGSKVHFANAPRRSTRSSAGTTF